MQLKKTQISALYRHMLNSISYVLNLPEGDFYTRCVMEDAAGQHQHMVQAFLGLGAINNSNQELPTTYLSTVFEFVDMYLSTHSENGVAYQVAGLFMHINMADVPTALLMDVLQYVEYKSDEHRVEIFSRATPKVTSEFYVRAITELARRGVV